MPSIEQFTQSRLSIVILDRKTDRFLGRLPLYAEVSATIELPPYTIHQELEFPPAVRQWLAKHPSTLDVINIVIAANVAESDFTAIADKQKFYLSIIKILISNLGDNESEEIRRNLIQKLVLHELKNLDINANPQPNQKILLSYPLGTLASDHAGYMSFDLSNVAPRFQKVLDGVVPIGSAVSFFAYPLGREDMKVDVLQQSRLTPEVVFGKISIDLPIDFDHLKKVSLPSMHNPGLEDWYLSPGSFAINPEFFIGTDGCENLYPANFATHEFSFFQVIRGTKQLVEPKTTNDKQGHIDIVLEVRTGWSLEYRVLWQPLGHTVGQIVYSLPLAPGEIVKIAVIDWARKSVDSRTEDLTVKEQLVHNTHRDRNISETVDAAMQEWQRGGSFMGGVAGSYGGGGYGISGALGGGYSTSSGDRKVHAATVQQISDAFAQASSSVRELRSTIVVQSDQQERAKAETRVVANHNHSHALTMLYYEVLRHYKVTTQFMRLRPSMLVQYARVDFNNTTRILDYRKILEGALIEPRYLGCFDAVQKLQCLTIEFERKTAQAALLPNLNDINEVGEINLVIKTQKATSAQVFIEISTKNRKVLSCQLVSPPWHSKVVATLPFQFKDGLPNTVDDPASITIDLNYRQDGQANVFKVKPFRTVIWSDVEAIIVKVDSFGGGAPPWIVESIQAISVAGGKTWVMLDEKQVISIPDGDQKLLMVKPYKDIPQDPADLLLEDERCCIEKLRNHLVANSFHYNKAVWLQEDPNARASRFRTITTGGTAIIDMIDNRPIDVLGDYVVFPARSFLETNEELDAIAPAKIEKLMTLPTRGVFAEAKLGHCNASEEIDDTRFWDWQTSPITEDAPGIDNLDINQSRNDTAKLTPTQLPSSIVNIVTPQALPDPTGMAGGMNLLGKSDIFRDMSVSKQVEALLEKLADKSVSIGEAADKAKDIQKQREAAPPAAAAVPATPESKSPAEAQKEIKVSENQANKGVITPDEHKENVKKTIDSMTGQSKGTELTVTINFKHSISGPLDGEFDIEFVGPIGGSFSTKTVGGVGAGKVTLRTGEQYTVLIRGKRTQLPVSLDTIARIPAVAGNPPFDVDVSNHITKREVPIAANIVATISKGRKALHITVVAEEVAKDITLSVKVTASGTLKADLEAELKLALVGIDVGHVKAGAAVEATTGAEASVELPIEYKRLTGTVTIPKNELEL